MLRLLLAVLLFVLHGFAPALAQTCTFSVTDVDFGNVDTASGAAVDTTGTVNITCNGNPSDNIRICPNIGPGEGGADGGTRQLRNPEGRLLNYNLFQDAARSIPWGSVYAPELGTTPPIDVTVGPSGSVSTSRTVYGRVFAGQQSAPTGQYSSIFPSADVQFDYVGYGNDPPACVTQLGGDTEYPSFSALANVMATCNVTAQDIDFGQRGMLDADVDATGSVDVICPPGTTYDVGLNNGLSGDSPTQRHMTLGDQTVTYGLYRDAARSQPWGNTTGTDTVPGTGTGTMQNITVYGRVPPQTTPSAGTYTDTVVVIVEY